MLSSPSCPTLVFLSAQKTYMSLCSPVLEQVAPLPGKSNLYASATVKRRWAKKAVCVQMRFTQTTTKTTAEKLNSFPYYQNVRQYEMVISDK